METYEYLRKLPGGKAWGLLCLCAFMHAVKELSTVEEEEVCGRCNKHYKNAFLGITESGLCVSSFA